jgi:hypothetical protein
MPAATRHNVAPTRGDEDEQHTARHEGLAASLGAEGERVGHHDDEHHGETGEGRPADVVHDRGDGGLELVLDDGDVEPELLPRP